MLPNMNLLKAINRRVIYRNLSHSWSPLAAAFNSSETKPNPNILKEAKGLFGIPELTSHEGFYALKESCILQTDNLLNEATDSNRTRKLVEVFDELSDTLCKVADLSEFIRVAHPNALHSKTAESTCIAVSGIVEKLNTNLQLYKALKTVVNQGDIFPTTLTDDFVASLFLFDFEQNGIHLPEADRQQVVQLNNAILHLGQHFMAGASNYRSVSKKNIPEHIIKLFNSDGENLLINGLHADSTNALVREFAYRVYLHHDGHQEDLLMQMLNLRYQLARKCGFGTYSERALKGSLLDTPSIVNDFLQKLSTDLRSRADADFNVMTQMKRKESGPTARLDPWDVLYFSSRAKREKFHFSSKEYCVYFSLGSCMDGLNNLMQALYGVTLVNTEVAKGEVWAPNVYKLAVVHETEGLLGYIYCDFFERTNKPNQDCHFTIQGGKEFADGSYQMPIVVLMLNLSQNWSNPPLLSPSMVDSLFHEMGHAMHSMLARTRYQHVTGTRCSTDFAEVPSILMEYFASDPRVLRTFARHHKTGEVIPAKMLECLCASKNVFAASDMQLQVFYSLLDQIYHHQLPFPNSSNTTDILSEVQKKYYSLPYVPGTAWQLRFSHLVGYGAKYYSYLVSKAVASYIWHMFFKDDPFSRKNGNKYRYECLAHGGGKPPRKLLTDFLQQEVTTDKLAESLISEIDDVIVSNVS